MTFQGLLRLLALLESLRRVRAHRVQEGEPSLVDVSGDQALPDEIVDLRWRRARYGFRRLLREPAGEDG